MAEAPAFRCQGANDGVTEERREKRKQHEIEEERRKSGRQCLKTGARQPLQDSDREDFFDHWKKGKTEFEFARDESRRSGRTQD